MLRSSCVFLLAMLLSSSSLRLSPHLRRSYPAAFATSSLLSSSAVSNSNLGPHFASASSPVTIHNRGRGAFVRFNSVFSRTRGAIKSSATRLFSAAAGSTAECAAPTEIFRKDYKEPANWVTDVKLDFDIKDRETTVTSTLSVDPNPSSPLASNDLVLDGDDTSISLTSVSLDGVELDSTSYTITPSTLTIHNPPKVPFKLTVKNVIVPEDNTQLSGLYKSGPMYCSQCEAEGFRRITYYPDRPDNMATFSEVSITADKATYPVLLSNGNRISTSVDGDRHTAVWSDPFPKPSYLFAVVAGDLGSIASSYTTTSGRKVHLEIFSERENVGQLDYAMESLVKSMKWDEDKFGLEYDLDIYNIVAVNDFNMGAMENKGLNVFNTAYVLADQKTASDGDYERVEGVIGHEYFHNWTGNRVTCRDWFQLTLKEGLTVFRDQEFSGDMGSKDVNRIENVKGLRARQFAEDASPMSHPIRPESYIAMDNFYTATVYSKGSEVIRMYQTLLGVDGFRKGMNLYFERHDGSAVTCDDFRAAMADANDFDLTQFERWYLQSGTPTVSYSSSVDGDRFTLHLAQTSPTQPDNLPFHIPISIGVIDSETGEELLPTTTVSLKEASEEVSFSLSKVPTGKAIPSVLRGFSAPVKLVNLNNDEPSSLQTLAAYDTDGFNRWEAGQKLTSICISKHLNGDTDIDMSALFKTFEQTLTSPTLTDDSIRAYALMLPSESGLAEEMDIIDPVGLRKARGLVKVALASEFKEGLKKMYDDLTAQMSAGNFEVNAAAIGKRRLRNVALDYLCALRESPADIEESAELAFNHYTSATCMTDKLAAMSVLSGMHGNVRACSLSDEVLKKFYEEAEGNALVINKWFTIQATSTKPDVLDDVKRLTGHPDFTLKNPNRCRSLISAFTANMASFHAEDGSGYDFIAGKVKELDKLNPQIASRMAGSLINYKRYDATRAEKMKKGLEDIIGVEGLSPDTYEVVARALK